MPVPSPVRAAALLAACCTLTAIAPAHAATCVWSLAGTGAFETPAHWTGCADMAGPSTRAPGGGDTAVVAQGTAEITMNSPITLAGLELGVGGVLGVAGSIQPVVTITGQLRLNGGTATSVLGVNTLRLELPAGSATQLLAPSRLANGCSLSNAGTMQLGSTSGVALRLDVAAELTNAAGGTITLAGGDSRLLLDGASSLTNAVGATLSVSGNAVIGKPPGAAAGTVVITNQGQFDVVGPGTLSMPAPAGSVQFRQYNQLGITQATLLCVANSCALSLAASAGAIAGRRIQLVDGTLDLGAPTALLSIPSDAVLAGRGALNGGISLSGRLIPGADAGAPFGTLSCTGSLVVGSAGTVAIDLGGAADTQRDRISCAGNAAIGGASALDGAGRLQLNVVDGYAPALGESAPVISYGTFTPDAAFGVIESDYALDFATRFDAAALVVFPAPRLRLVDNAVVEGNSGESALGIDLVLSQPGTLPVTAQVAKAAAGTAGGGDVFGLLAIGNGGFVNPIAAVNFAPGEVTQRVRARIFGDTSVEADEDFVVELPRHGLTNAAFGNGVSGRLTGIGTILSDDVPAGTRYLLAAQRVATQGVRRYDTNGTFYDSWNVEASTGQVAGMCGDGTGNVLVTRFNMTNGPVLFSRNGAPRQRPFGPVSGVSYFNHESCVVDAEGQIYIGQAGEVVSSDPEVPILRFGPGGVLRERILVPTGTRGTDWIELGADPCVLLYTSEDAAVRRYDRCAGTALPDLTSALQPPCFALKRRANDELLVACQDNAYRLDAAGVILRTYPRTGLGETNPQGLFALALDPDGSSFWTAGLQSGNVYRVDIETGNVLTTFNAGSSGVSGLLVQAGAVAADGVFADSFE